MKPKEPLLTTIYPQLVWRDGFMGLKRWVHAFPKVINANWNSNTLFQDLNSAFSKENNHYIKRMRACFAGMSVYAYFFVHIYVFMPARTFACMWTIITQILLHNNWI